MALIAMTTADTVDFVSTMDPSRTVKMVPNDPNDPSKGEREVVDIGPDASVFKLRPLDVYLMGSIYDNASVMRGKQGTDEVDVRTKINETNIQAVKFGLAGLPSNFKDSKGNPIRFQEVKEIVNRREYRTAADAVLNALGLRLISEMADRIKEISEVSAAEEKNLEAA